MKYLKMIVTNPWIILLSILTIHNTFRVYDTAFNSTNFILGLLVMSLVYAIINKLRLSIRKEQLEKLDRMSRASIVVLHDGKGKEVVEEGEEYTRGFREASSIIIEDLK